MRVMLALLALLVISCTAAPPPTPPTAPPTSAPPAVPPSAPPAGTAQPNADFYDGAPVDPEGYIDAFRQFYPAAEAPDDIVLDIGARMCSYFLRHADEQLVVNMTTAYIEAGNAEPGMTHVDWNVAFELANRYYCPEFEVEPINPGSQFTP